MDDKIDGEDVEELSKFLAGEITSWSHYGWEVADKPNTGYYLSKVTVNGRELPFSTVGGGSRQGNYTLDGSEYELSMIYVNGAFHQVLKGPRLPESTVRFEHTETDKYTMSRSTDGKGEIVSYRFGGDATVDDIVDYLDWVYINGVMGDAGNEWSRQFAINACLQSINIDKSPEIGSGRVTNNDWIALQGILDGSRDPYDPVYRLRFDWEVVDEPDDGYFVSKVTLNEQELEIPANNGESATTTVSGHEYTVTLSADGIATVSGPNLRTNDVYIEHTPYFGRSLTFDTDGHGDILSWRLPGDPNADQTVDPADYEYIRDALDGLAVTPAWKGDRQQGKYAPKDDAHQSDRNGDLNADNRITSDDVSETLAYISDSAISRADSRRWEIMELPDAGYYVSKITVNGQDLEVPDVNLQTDATTRIGNYEYRVFVGYDDPEDPVLAYRITGPTLETNDVRIEHAESSKYTMSRGTDGLGDIVSYRFGGDATVDDVVDYRDWFYINGYMGDLGPTWSRQFAINACLNEDRIHLSPEEEDSGRVADGDWGELNLILSGLTDPYTQQGLRFDWEVVDKPKSGYHVSKVTLNGQELRVPEKNGESAVTTVSGQKYTVALDANGNATVSGPNLRTNDVYIEHAKEAKKDIAYKVEYYYQVKGAYPAKPGRTESRTGTAGKEVKATNADKKADKAGYVLDEKAANVLTAVVAEDGSTVLKVYFKQQFTVTFDLNGGKFSGSTASIKRVHDYGDVILILAAPSRDGYDFQYWKGSEYHPGERYTVTEDHIFTAQWKAKSGGGGNNGGGNSGGNNGGGNSGGGSKPSTKPAPTPTPAAVTPSGHAAVVPGAGSTVYGGGARIPKTGQEESWAFPILLASGFACILIWTLRRRWRYLR